MEPKANRKLPDQHRLLTPVLPLAFLLFALALAGCVPGKNWVYMESERSSTADLPTPAPVVDWLQTAPTPTAAPSQQISTKPAPTLEALVLAHYMVWFRTPAYSGYWYHWDWDPNGNGGSDHLDHIPDRLDENGRYDLATAHYPLIGPYDSLDPALVEYQLASAWAAGIRGFVVDWYGPNDVEGLDRAAFQVLQKIEDWQAHYGFQFYLALTYEEQILNRIPQAQQEETAVAHLRHVLESYARSPAYLTYQNTPVIFMFQAWTDGQPGLLTPEQLQRVQASLPEFHLLYMGAEQAYLPVTDGFYSWVGGTNSDPADWGEDYANWLFPEQDFQTAQHGLDLTVGSVWAGFDDSGVNAWDVNGLGIPRFVERQDGLVYQQTWSLALQDKQTRQRAGPAWVQIVTWNDWNEGSEIEPSLEDGRFYLEQTQLHAAEYTGTTLPPLALVIPELVYLARQQTPGPETEAVIADVYELFFSYQFEAAYTRLSTAGLAQIDGDDAP